MSYEVFSGSVRGASHIRRGTPCEDYGLTLCRDGIIIFAVADGHGDSNCVRSNIGSKLACEIAIKQMTSFAETVMQNRMERNLLDKQRQSNMIRQLVYSIVGAWLDATNDDLMNCPLSEDEYGIAKRCADEYRAGIRTERIYGTTLIAGLMTAEYLLLIQQGDGHCDVFDAQGNVSQPIPWDERCFGTATTSLCDIDAADSFRFCVIDLSVNPVIACIAGSDGVEDSYPTSMDKTHAYYRRLLAYACNNGVDSLIAELPDELNRLSSNGSADDITVCGFVDIEQTKHFLSSFDEQNYAVDLRDEYSAICEKISSIETGGKFEYLRKKYNEVMSRYTSAEKEYTSVTIEYNRVKNDIDSFCATSGEQTESELPDDKRADGLGILETSAADERFFPYGNGNDASEQKHGRFHEHRLSSASIDCLKRRLDVLYRKREAIIQELQSIEKEKVAVEQEFIPYQKQYQTLLQERAEVEAKLKSIGSNVES